MIISTRPAENTVALYWDFENIHACVIDSVNGPSAYNKGYARVQQPVVDIATIVNYAASIGVIAINRAYNNWTWYGRYSDALSENGLDLIQLYPIGAKNSADIRLALDVIEDLQRFTHITHVVVVSSDRDYIGLAQKIKQLGRTIVGVGVRDNTNPFWVKCCNEFKYYENLVARTAPPVAAETEDPAAENLKLEDARPLLLRALRDLAARRGSRVVPRAQVKGLMLRYDPAFDEAAMGFSTFSRFLDNFSDVIENIPDASGGSVRLRPGVDAVAESVPPPLPMETEAFGGVEASGAVPGLDPSSNYARILKRGNFRVMPAPWWRAAVAAFERVFAEADGQQFATFDELRQRVVERLHEDGLDGDPSLVSKLRINLFYLHLFQLFPDKTGFRLLPDPAGRTLLERVDAELIHRLRRFATPPLDEAAVAFLFFGVDDGSSLARTRQLIEQANRQVEANPIPPATGKPAET